MENFSLQLIEHVKRHEYLYNTKHGCYRNINARKCAWEEIGKAFNMPGIIVKDEWDKLRRCYINALSRQREAQKIDPSGKKTAWKFETEMAFLLPFTNTKRSRQTVDESQDGPTEVKTEHIEEIFFDHDEDDETEHCHQTSPSWLNEDDESMEMIQRNKRKLSKRNDEDSAEKYQQIESKYSENLDEMDLFFLSMSRMTKKLPKIEQVRIKLELSNSVLTAEMKEAANN